MAKIFIFISQMVALSSHKPFIYRYLLIACLFSAPALKSLAQTQQSVDWSIEVKGVVTENDKKLPGSVITVYEGGNATNTINSGDGKFDFQLDPDQNYVITFTKSGYITKRISFSTKNVPANRAKHGFSPFDIEVDIFPEIPGTDVDKILQQPIARIGYDPTYKGGDFTFDESYTASIQSLLDKIIAAKKALDAQYKKLISQADNEFDKQTYTDAKNDYTAALKLKPYEQYPKDQLKAIEKALKKQQEAARKNSAQIAKQKALQAKYDSLVKVGDTNFNAKNYANAKAAYNGALQVKPDEQYPKDQLAAIDKAMASAKANAQKAAAQKALQTKYDSLVKVGDNNFKTKNYANAKAAYNGALQVKPDEQYPKDQLAAIDKAIAEAQANAQIAKQKALQAKYDSLVKVGDTNFKSKNYTNAKAAYNGALQVKPDEQYPKDQLAAIDKAMASAKANAQKAAAQKALQAKYDSLVKVGDTNFKAKNYANAKAAYNGALQVKPDEQYPKDQLAAIDKAMAEAKTNAQKATAQKALQAKYDSLVKVGDANFNAKNYTNAKAAYNGALQVKPDEQYPKDQLAAIDKAIAEAEKEQNAKQQAILAKYDSVVKLADTAFNGAKYSDAKDLYTDALQIKPDEKYPQAQLVKINKLIAESEKAAAEQKQNMADQALQAKYDSVIKLADDAFNGAKYSDAKDLYTDALQIKPDEKYPQAQLLKISKLLAESQKAAAEAEAEKEQNAKQHALQAKYDSVIKLADDAFNGTKYSDAKDLYTDALQIKPDEKYPKLQLAKIDRMFAENKQKQKAEQQRLHQNREKAQYDSIIKLADLSFHAKEYTSAEGQYESALKIKPAYRYPKQQIALIKKLLFVPKPEVKKDTIEKPNNNKPQVVIAPVKQVSVTVPVFIASCNIRAMGDSCRPYLRPFFYDAVNALHLPLKNIAQEKEINFPAYSGQRYRIIINISGMPQGTTVIVYDKDSRHKRRKALYSVGDAIHRISFFDADSKTGRFFIDYEIPPSAAKHPGSCCAVVMFGFESR